MKKELYQFTENELRKELQNRDMKEHIMNKIDGGRIVSVDSEDEFSFGDGHVRTITIEVERGPVT